MNRREFMRTAGGATVVASATAAATGPSAAQEDGNETGTPSGNESGGGNESDDGGGGGGGGGGGTEEVVVGPGGDLSFDPEELTIAPGTTVVWNWDSDGHNVMPDSIPEESDWEGHEPIEDEGFSYEHTFEVEGTFDYVCTPHEQAGMVGSIEVTQDPGGGEGGAVEKEPEEMGVPIQAHYVGISTILAILVSLVFTFFQLKYGESPHASGGNR